MTDPAPPFDVSVAELKARLDAKEDLLLLDCRNPDEWETARIEGAQLLPMGELVQRADAAQEPAYRRAVSPRRAKRTRRELAESERLSPGAEPGGRHRRLVARDRPVGPEILRLIGRNWFAGRSTKGSRPSLAEN